MYQISSVVAALCAFLALMLFPNEARQGAVYGLSICAGTIIPSLFPFFVVSMLLSKLGFAELIGRRFRSGRTATAFLIGISGGYPLGAAYTAQVCQRDNSSDKDALKMLICCNNSGPAFILGAVGSGVFNSSKAGLFLYAVHILAALSALLLLAPHSGSRPHETARVSGFAAAFTTAVKASVTACLSVCGFICAFSVLASIIDVSGAIALASEALSATFGLDPGFFRCLLLGIFELGNAVSAMEGLPLCPHNLALAAFLLSWGGISVHFQTFSVISGVDIKAVRYMTGRLLIAIFSFVLAYFGAGLLF